LKRDLAQLSQRDRATLDASRNVVNYFILMILVTVVHSGGLGGCSSPKAWKFKGKLKIRAATKSGKTGFVLMHFWLRSQ